MRFRKVTLLLIVAVAAGIAVLCIRPAAKMPQAYLVQLTRAVTNGTSSAADASNWLMGNTLGDQQQPWNAEFEIRNPDGSGILLSHEKVDVQALGPTGDWTIAAPEELGPSFMDLFPESESTYRISMRRIRVTVRGETQRVRLAVRLRALTAQERCRDALVRSGLWRHFPKASAWISERLPRTKHWREWHPEIDFLPAPTEQDASLGAIM